MDSLPLADLDPRQIALGHRLDGVLGSEFFARFVVTFDFAGRTVMFRDAKTFRHAGKGPPLAASNEGGLLYVDARLIPRGGKAVEGKFLVDTASDGAVTLFSPFVREHPLAGPPPSSSGGGGTMQGILRAEALEIGGHRLREPLVTLAGATTGPLSDARHAGSIGMEVLRRFNVTVDASRGRLFLEKNAAFGEPFDYDASGLRLQPQGKDLTTLEIRSVRPGSAGANAGLRAGDVILALDGRPIGEITLPGVRRLFQKNGNLYSLSVLRAGAIFQAKLQCRRQI